MSDKRLVFRRKIQERPDNYFLVAIPREILALMGHPKEVDFSVSLDGRCIEMTPAWRS